jgi:pilus assembly protein CpaB
LRRRLLAALAALVLAVVGAVVLVAYARGADRRALEGVASVPVYVITAPIAKGTSADDLGSKVRAELVPVKAAAADRVRFLHDITGKVATVDLEPGEQLLSSRFGSPSSLQAPGTVATPKGDGNLAIQLDPQRAIGGRVAAGDKVGVYVSYKLPDGTGVTHVVLHRVLVTQVQGAPVQPDAAAPDQKDAVSSSGGAAPTSNLMVTLAVSAQQAEAVVFGVEHGQIWLSLEPKDASTGGTDVITQQNIYGKAFA